MSMGRFPGKVCYCGNQELLSFEEESDCWAAEQALNSARTTHAKMCEGHREPAIIFKASWEMPERILGFSFKMIIYGQFEAKPWK